MSEYQGPNKKYAYTAMRPAVTTRIVNFPVHPNGRQQQQAKNQPAEAMSAAPTKKNGYFVQSGIELSAATNVGSMANSSTTQYFLMLLPIFIFG